MQEHTKIYFKYFGYDQGDFIPCEVTGNVAVDISHNDPRGMGGRKSANYIENLMALTRDLHNFLEMNPSYIWWFHLVHMHFMNTRIPYAESKYADKDPILKKVCNI